MGKTLAKLLLELKYYDEAGRVKPGFVFTWCALFLCRSVLLFALSLTLHNDGVQLLGFFYPEKKYLYVGMVIAAPAFIAYLLVAFRESLANQQQYWLFYLIKPLFLISCILDITLHYYLAKATFWQFSWTVALSLIIDVLLSYYFLKDRHLRLLIRDWAKTTIP